MPLQNGIVQIPENVDYLSQQRYAARLPGNIIVIIAQLDATGLGHDLTRMHSYHRHCYYNINRQP
jgi:hypothetical protein